MSMEDEKIRLKVLGISYSHIQSGAYALILSQVGGPYKIPVVIGAAENYNAQAHDTRPFR